MPDAETIRINEPAIKAATSDEHYNAVRAAYKVAMRQTIATG
jgi:hypothetical protein